MPGNHSRLAMVPAALLLAASLSLTAAPLPRPHYPQAPVVTGDVGADDAARPVDALLALEAPAGTWHLRQGGNRLRLELDRGLDGQLFGQVLDDTGSHPAQAIQWQAASGELSFIAARPDGERWHRGQVVEGIYKGRMALAVPGTTPPLAGFEHHVTGWNAAVLDRGLAPRRFDLVVNHHYRARLRIDADPQLPDRYTGQFKVHANTHPDIIAACMQRQADRQAPWRWSVDATLAGWTSLQATPWPAACEELEFDVQVDHWDGQTLHFSRIWANGFWQAFSGTVHGHEITGVFTEPGTPQLMPWTGQRAEVLAAGLSAPDALPDWQMRTRARLQLLKMAGNPQPLQTQVLELQTGVAPLPGIAPHRDDDPHSWPQDYQLTELKFLHELANPYGAVPLQRRGHAWLATPNGMTGERRPAVLVLNGHGGSAWRMMDPAQNDYWYGDAFARRGYITLALDVSHRSHGDHPDSGNIAHPPIAAPGFSTDWEEEGERIWTAMRAIDYLLSRPDVDGNRLVVAGLSMGGEVAALLGAMDPRIGTVVVAGYTPDFNVMAHNDNHPCWQWQYADIREYVDMADYLTLIAPRNLIAVTGRNDPVFSRFHAPFAADKQVLHRTRLATAGSAYWPGWQPVHFLHPGGHQFRVGDKVANGGGASHVQVPQQAGPQAPLDKEWQIDGTTTSLGVTLFDLIEAGQDPLFTNGFES